MSVVTVNDEDPFGGALPPFGEWTVDDLEKLPDDGRRYELYDGVLVVSPAPTLPHQRALRALFRLLDGACPPELEVIFAPLDFQPTRQRSFQPDILVFRTADVDPNKVMTTPPVLTVEVLSPSTRSLDQVFKREMYATSAVPNYWTFDPKRAEFTAYERDNSGTYVVVAHAVGEQRVRVQWPYPVEICPNEIVA